MAGDWIKWTKGLAKRREVIVIAAKLGRCRHEIAGRLMELWEWCDDNMTEADIVDADVSLILGDSSFAFVDALLGLPGMAEALSSPDVKWIELRSGGRVVFPNLARHNGTSAKTRAYEAAKKQKQRNKSKPVPEMSPNRGDKTGTREEKRRDKDNSHVTAEGRETWLPGQSEAFKRFTAIYPRKTAPAEAWKVWQSTVAGLVGERGLTDQAVEEMLIDRAEAYIGSPAGLPPPPGRTEDFRPSPAKWLKDGKYDEPYSEWQKPNITGGTHGNTRKRGRSGGSASPEQERFDSSIDVLAAFAGGAAAQSSGVRGVDGGAVCLEANGLVQP